ncbi:RNA-directed DNA polymerase, eukaryota, reverse transcriptase zinc-binding domain protein [Tanacetum coccineum]
MINLVMTCVSSTSFSICVNRDRHGYFKGGRGLRQRDPILPYLFTMVMELKISHLCFADDLVVLCHGDVKIVKVVKGALDHFCNMSGLKPNLGKSTTFFGNIKDHVKQAILAILPFKIGSLPVSYLGVPLVSKQIGINDCKRLTDKIKERVLNWKNKMLTYVGRLQLIASVLSTIHMYSASVFMLPKIVIKDIDRILKGFLWNQGDLKKGSAKISWKVVCEPKIQGGLGLKDLGACNEVLMTKHLWNIAYNIESLWVKWVNVIRNGEECFMWFDKWGDKALSKIIPIDAIQEANFNLNMKACEMIKHGEWKWPLEWRNRFNAIANLRVPHLDSNNVDSTV